MKKNIILCFRHQAFFNSKIDSTFYGIGDIMKSFLSAYLFCKQNNFNFFVNFDGHCLKSFLNFKKNDFRLHFKNKKIPKNVPFIKGPDFFGYIEDYEGNDVFLTTDGNNLFNFHYEDEVLHDFKETFFSNPKIKSIYESNFSGCKKVFHARLGDGNMVSDNFLNDFYLRDFRHQYSSADWYNSISFDDLYPFILKNFKEEISSCDYISSDHLFFKKLVSSNFDIKFTDSESVHLGIKTPSKNLISTLCDLYSIFYSDGGVSISQYPFSERPSGFVYWIDKVFLKDYKYYAVDWLYKGIKPINSF